VRLYSTQKTLDLERLGGTKEHVARVCRVPPLLQQTQVCDVDGGLALQCVAVCCSLLQCVAVCCRVLQCAAVCCSVLQHVAACCSVLHCVALCCSTLFQVISLISKIHPPQYHTARCVRLTPTATGHYFSKKEFTTELTICNDYRADF